MILSTITRARSPLQFAAAALGPTVPLYALLLGPRASARALHSKLSRCSSAFDPSYQHHQHRNLLFAHQFVPPHIDADIVAEMARGGGYYAVQKGKIPGVYRTWGECEANTKGFPGAVFKKFASEREAREFLVGDGYAGKKKDEGGGVGSGGGADVAQSRGGAPQQSIDYAPQQPAYDDSQLSNHHPQPAYYAARPPYHDPPPTGRVPQSSKHAVQPPHQPQRPSHRPLQPPHRAEQQSYRPPQSSKDAPQQSYGPPQQSYGPPEPFNHSAHTSTRPYLPVPPLHNNPAANKRNQAPAPARMLGKRRVNDYADEPAPSKRAHVDPVFPPPHSAAAASGSASGSKRKTVVYCDGSSIGNGKKGARAGWGVFFEDPELKHLNESRRLPGPVQTNNRAELTALIRAVQLCPDDGRQLVIFTDSRYSMDAVTKWLPGWKKNGYKTSSGGPVQNLDLVLQLEHELRERYPHPKLEYVKAHCGIEGNETVDRMAKFGASLPIEDSTNLNKRSTATEGFVKHEELEHGLGKRGELQDGFEICVSVTPTKVKR